MDKTMENQLREAAVGGDTPLLSKLLEKYPRLIDENYAHCEDKNVLHIGAMYGNKDFVRKILQLDSSAAHDMCLARDRDGRNPVHLAAIHGRLSVLELVNDYDLLMLSALEKADHGGTILHLFVKFNQLEALKFLLRTFSSATKFVGAKNNDGMTILHMAVHILASQNSQKQSHTALQNNPKQRRRHIILHLIDNARHIINEVNAYGETAVDLYLEQPGSGRDQEIRTAFSRNGGTVSKALPSSFLEKFEDNRNAIGVAASIIATVAFQMMVNPPGGVWQDNKYGKDGRLVQVAGESVFAHTHLAQYNDMVGYVTSSFVASLATILLHLISGLLIRDRFMLTMVLFTQCAAILGSGLFMSIAYGSAFASIVPPSSKWHMRTVLATVMVVFSVISTPILVFIVILLIYKVTYKARRRCIAKELTATPRP